jgi:PIN domain nuclease of toxin-antitoxin system
MRHALDTHVLLWWYADDPKLPRTHRRLLSQTEKQKARVGVSAISLWEIAKLVERRRLRLSRGLDDLLADIEANPAIEVLPISARIAAESTRLGTGFPNDPADQVIVATARCHGLILLTRDDAIRDSGAVPVL